jgi:AmpD protein
MVMPFKIDPITGLLAPVTFLSSPHCDERPGEAPIDMIVVHGISLPPGEFGTHAVPAFFCGELDFSTHPAYASLVTMRVSAHLFIRRTGEVIQFVPFNKRAWHAGESFFQGKSRCNDFSIGIELEGTDEVPYTSLQYDVLSQVIRVLMSAYPGITLDRVLGHHDIAPGRKTDPGPVFDWPHLKGTLA